MALEARPKVFLHSAFQQDNIWRYLFFDYLSSTLYFLSPLLLSYPPAIPHSTLLRISTTPW